MDPVTRAVLLSWDWRWEVILVLALAGILYSRGWRRLRGRTFEGKGNGRKQSRTPRGRWRLAVKWRLVSYWVGLFFVAIALLSPIDVLSRQLFLMHMIQHLLLIMFAPPLLLIANPMPFMLWGLPDGARLSFGSFLAWLLRKDAPFRNSLMAITSPGFLWLLWAIFLYGWHDPYLYNAALYYEWVHDVEHLSFFITSMLFWWNITQAGPRIHKKVGMMARVALALAAVPVNAILGAVLAFNPEPVYTYYLSVPRLWGISVMSDQQIGGVIMWVPGSMMFFLAAFILIARMVGKEEQKPSLPAKKWVTEDSMAAPGLEK
ncbi:MAG: cytochrome c oxidase assembly protein [Chloroflexi bacterium]|nr:MAG: cytochrome c oxidase assembly protein [Chloroflexota bacterium]